MGSVDSHMGRATPVEAKLPAGRVALGFQASADGLPWRNIHQQNRCSESWDALESQELGQEAF